MMQHLVFWIMMPSSVIAIYFARVHYWDASFVANGATQIGNVHTTWFAFFQGVCKSLQVRSSRSQLTLQPHTLAVDYREYNPSL